MRGTSTSPSPANAVAKNRAKVYSIFYEDEGWGGFDSSKWYMFSSDLTLGSVLCILRVGAGVCTQHCRPALYIPVIEEFSDRECLHRSRANTEKVLISTIDTFEKNGLKISFHPALTLARPRPPPPLKPPCLQITLYACRAPPKRPLRQHETKLLLSSAEAAQAIARTARPARPAAPARPTPRRDAPTRRSPARPPPGLVKGVL